MYFLKAHRINLNVMMVSNKELHPLYGVNTLPAYHKRATFVIGESEENEASLPFSVFRLA